jgi:uncharacterized tellurite resistance protein B-like protein
MSRARQFIFFLAAVTVVCAAQAQTPPAAHVKFSAATNFVPLPPATQSPVSFFRQLLAMSAVERNQSLTNRPPEVRARILAKVREYQALGPDERELRLRATELRWYLTPLLRTPPAERAAGLEQTPPDLRELAEARLTQWDSLPPKLQQEFLANDKTLQHFFRVETTNRTANPEQQKITEQFNQFFEVKPEEKKQILAALSETERAQMEKTLKTFEQLPPQQRVQCVRNYAKFAGMSGTERAEFLKNAENWSKMSPAERQSWRDLVANVPMWPPSPPPALPPVPRAAPKAPRASMATN